MNEKGIWSFDEACTQHAYDKFLAHAISKILPNEKVIDFGCGRGDYLSFLSEKGFDCIGIEGTPEISKIAAFNNIINADLTEKLNIGCKGTVISLEVAEHIPIQYENDFLDNLDRHCSGMMILSWAVVGQGGHGHINEQNSDYVISKLYSLGYDIDVHKTEYLRSVAYLWWFKKSVYVFGRRNGSCNSI